MNYVKLKTYPACTSLVGKLAKINNLICLPALDKNDCDGNAQGGCLVAFTLQVYFFSPLSSPQVLHLPDESLSHSFPPLNNRLQEVTKIGEGILKKPEDVSVDKEGRLYTATRDGWIRRLLKNGTLENWKVNEDGVTIILSHVNGSKLRFADDVIEAKDGSLYFSIASTKYGLHEWYLDVLEARPHGNLLKYDPQTKQTRVLLDNLCFANGVALSTDQDYLLVCESWKFRCLKYWLQGDQKGKIEIFVENLPGAPDNINLAPDGSFWIALFQVAKHLVATFPRASTLVHGMHKKATVVKVAQNGQVLKRFDDPDGKVISFVTSALEYDGHLYLGSLNANFIGKLPLNG
ncbi:hypothetical protein Cgig2_017913 [Carnegiea gigantea]|uniref:Strictosidine synthase conserved region domain-containing protein n=1 Tax=Carnegiea gigantea TaxID=171969 RepID=A0A9Q1K717_9CARY|nr:hypothetical protein Cgig2_017913 [Carnegiea gigantea]